MDTSDYDAQLERRLQIIEDPGYDDPARVDLPALDLMVLAVVGVVLIVVMWIWGYPG